MDGQLQVAVAVNLGLGQVRIVYSTRGNAGGETSAGVYDYLLLLCYFETDTRVIPPFYWRFILQSDIE